MESQVRRKILQILLEAGRPLKPLEIAKEAGLSVPSSTMHLLRLVKAGYVSTPERGYYAVTDRGREELELPKIDKNQASRILSTVPLEKAFHFYTGINQYLQVYADSLNDFCDKIQTVDVQSVEFHMSRKDFESWFQSLGDSELVKGMGSIREKGLSGENLRREIYNTVKSRCEELRAYTENEFKLV